MREYRVRFSPTARRDILQTYTYIRDTAEAPLNASRWLEGIIAAIADLSVYPESHGLAR